MARRWVAGSSLRLACHTARSPRTHRDNQARPARGDDRLVAGCRRHPAPAATDRRRGGPQVLLQGRLDRACRRPASSASSMRLSGSASGRCRPCAGSPVAAAASKPSTRRIYAAGRRGLFARGGCVSGPPSTRSIARRPSTITKPDAQRFTPSMRGCWSSPWHQPL